MCRDKVSTTARRTALFEILRHERFLTRQQLITRVEGLCGQHCFGKSVRVTTFYRDMQAVKQALRSAGYQLAYSRKSQQAGYYLLGQPALSQEMAEILKSSLAEVDPAQISIFRQMSPAERVRLGCSVSDTARKVVAYRIRQRNPGLTRERANFLQIAFILSAVKGAKCQ